ncbi:hypothetical protein ACFSLT_06015 [Novosphingobium resinovorum]
MGYPGITHGAGELVFGSGTYFDFRDFEQHDGSPFRCGESRATGSGSRRREK